MYRKYKEEEKIWAFDLFKSRDFKATEILNNEEFLIFDWRESSGSGNLACRYILDKKKGVLTIYGDSGDCIACWYGEVTAENMECYVNSIGYFMEKIQCASDKYTYYPEDIEKDIEKLRNEFETEILPECLEGLDSDEAEELEEECKEKFEELIALIEEAPETTDGLVLIDKAIEIIEDLFENCWWETGFEDLGKRISSRVYLWSVGYQMGYAQLAAGKEKL